MFESLKIGESAPFLAGLPEGCFFECDGSGLVLIYNFFHPSQKEIEAFKADVPGEVRFVRVGGVLFILSKLGTLEWMDSPYAVQLSRNISFPEIPQGQGYSLLLILADAANSKIMGLRYVGLGTKFSEQLHDEVMADINVPIVKPMYDAKVQQLYARYTTKDLVKLSKTRYKIGEK